MESVPQKNISKNFKTITWLNIIIQFCFPLAYTFTPMLASSSTIDKPKLLLNNNQLNYRQTQTYRLKEGDSTASIAQKYNIHIDDLRKLNQFRTFSHPFEQLKPGDELDIPTAPLPTIQWDSEKLAPPTTNSEEVLFAQLASQTGHFLSNKPSQDSAESLARNIAMSKASNSIQQWLNKAGNAQIRLEADKNLSLKNSQFNLLLPLYETKEKLIFTQSNVHNTDKRIQANVGLGIRWFGDKQMIGGNTFLDYDISRGHSRLGLGAEYRRDFLSLSANSYHPISHWKNAKILDDHIERPAHGWDLRAEGWLPNYPQLGGKLTYEQYYGDKVALFGPENLQRNPSAITAGINYTPFPLLTLNAEQRKGSGKKQDSRIGLNVNYYLNKSWKEHLDSNAMNQLRSLIGSRYDFVNRNNNIILEYQKNAVIYLSIGDTIIGYAGEKKPLNITVNSKYGLKQINLSAPRMMAAGGKIINEKNGLYSIILPEYKSGNKAVNLYTLNAVAIDKKGNSSPSTSLQVVVSQPSIHVSQSSISPSKFTLIADGKSTQALRLLIKDKTGKPIDISTSEIRLEKSPEIKRTKRAALFEEAKGLISSRNKKLKIGKFTRLAAGEYEVILIAGTQIETLSLVPIVRETSFSPIHITIIADKVTPQVTKPTVNTTQPQVANGKNPVEVTVQLVDANGNPLANTEVTWSSNKNPHEVIFKDTVTKTDEKGFATAVVESVVAGDIQITATTDNATPQDVTVTFVADKTTSTIAPNNIQVTQTETVANGTTPNTIEIKVSDANGNPIPNTEVKFHTDKGQLTETVVKTDNNGMAKTEITSTEAGNATVTITVDGKDTTQQIAFVSDKTTSTVTPNNIQVVNQQTVANGKTPNPIEITVTDAHGNPVPNVEVQFSSDKGQLTTHVVKTDSNGVAKTEITSTEAGNATVTITVDGKDTTQQIAFVSDKTTSTVTPNNIQVANQQTVANGKTPNPIEITVTDAHGNPVPNVEVHFNTDKGQLTTHVVKTDSNGVAKTEITSTEVGNATVTITVDGKDTTQQIAFVSDKTTSIVTPNNIQVANQQTVANGKTPNPIAVTVIDAQGNPVPNVEVQFSSDKGQITTAAVTTDSNGVATTEITSTEAGTATVTITVNGNDTTQQIAFVSDKTTSAVSPNNIQVASQQTVANGKNPNPIAVTVTDAHGNPVPNVEVHFSADKGQLTTNVVTTDNNGVAKTEITSTEAGTATVTITVNGNDTTQQIAFVSDKTTPLVTKPTVNTTKPQVANGKQPFEIKTLITDANGNPIANTEVKWSSNQNTSDISFSKPTTLTDKDGYATTQVTSTIAANVIISASTNNAAPQDITVQFVPDNSTSTIKPADLIISHTSSVADGSTPNAIEVTVTDAQGNKVPNIEVTFVTNHGKLVDSKVTTDANGVAKTQITSTQAGNAQVSISVGGNHFDKTISFVANHKTAKVASITPETKKTYLADGKTTVIYTAKIVDANQNPVLDANVDWSSDVTDVVFNHGTSKTNDKGIATVIVTTTKAKSTVITATTNSHHQSASAITFVADSAKAQITAFNINKSTLIANQVDTAIIETLITDNHGNPVKNIAVKLTSNRGKDDNLKALTPLFKTDKNGYVTVEIDTAKAGDIILSAEIANNSQAKSATIKAIADNATASVSIAAPSGNIQISPNAKVITLTATVKDAQQNPLTNAPVTWLSTHNQLETNTTLTDSQGRAKVKLSGYTSGETKVTAQLLNNVSKEVSIQFIAGTAKQQNSALEITPQTLIANGQEQATAILRLKDQWDNPVIGQTIKWESNNNTITLSDMQEDPTNKGVYYAKIGGTRAGTFEVKASTGTVIKQKTIGFIADHSTSTINNIKVTGHSSAKADGVERITVQTTVTDATGSPVANVPVGWKTEIGELNQLITHTDYNGIAQATLTSTVAGKGKVSAILGASTKETAGEITFLAGNLSTSSSTMAVTVPSITAGIGKTNILVHLKDDTGNPLWGLSDKITLSYSTNLGLNTTPVFTESQTTAGTYHAELSGIIAGKTNISAYVNGTKLDNDVPFTVVPDNQTARVRGSIVPTKTQEIVGTRVTYSATFEDSHGNLLGQGVPIFWIANDGTLLSAHQTMTDTNGQSSITVKRDVIGNAEVTINLTSQNNKAAPTVRFNQGAIDVSKTTLELTPTTIVAGQSSRLNIVLKDQLGNLLTRQSAAIKIISSSKDISVGSVSEATLLPGNYQATLTSNKAGTSDLSVQLNGIAVTQTKTLHTTGNKASWHITSLVPDNKTIKAGDKTGVTYKATVVDQYNNPLPDINVSWHLQGRAEPFAYSSVTNAQGIAEIKLTSFNTGELVMTAVLSDKVEKKADVVQVVANDFNPQLSTFTTNKTDIGPDGQEEVLFTVKLLDSFGNPVLHQPVTINSNVSTSDFTITQVTDLQNGQYSAKATAALSAAGKGSIKLTAKVGNQTIAQPIDIKIDAITPSLSFGDNVKKLTYSSKTNAGQTIKGLPSGFTPRWSSDNTSIATVNDQGEIQLKKAGHTKIWARIDGNGVYKSAEVSYELDVAKAKPELKLTSNKTVSAVWDDGSMPKIEFAFDNNDVAALPVEFISKNASIAHVDFQTGVISQIKPGKAQLMVSTRETDKFLADSQEVTYELAKARFNIDFANAEQETSDEKTRFNLQQPRIAAPAKAGAKWSSSHQNIVNIDSNGAINGLGKGAAQLTLAINNNDYYENSTASYTAKVYAKPNLPATNLVYRNNGQEEHSGSQWFPVYTDDTLTVHIPPIHYTEYDKPTSIEVTLKSGNRTLHREKLQNWSIPNTITYQPEVGFYQKDLAVEIRAEGKVGLNIVASQQHNMQVDYIDPSKIGTITTDYNPRYIISTDNKDDSDKKCLARATAWVFTDRHFMVQPITKVDIGSKELLIPLTIYHSIEKVNGDVNDFSFNNHYTIKKSDRNQFNLTTTSYAIKDACLDDNFGNARLKTHLTFGGKSSTAKDVEFYWEGLNRWPHKPQI